MKRKTIALMILNVAAAMVIGLCAGILYKNYQKKSGAAGNVPERELLYRAVAAIADPADAKIGVAFITSGGDTVVYDNQKAIRSLADTVPEASSGDVFYPMLSVFKFHQALAVCGWLRQGGIPLDTEVDVTPDMLQENTWSPLRDEHPQGGRFPYGTLLTYSLVQSDNNACDILFSLTGGPAMTDRYIRSLGVDGFDIECTEAMMHENLADCYRNRTTPLSAVLLLEKFLEERGRDGYSEFIWQAMTSCGTGRNRIPGRISADGVTIAHKTGTGDIGPDGRIIGVNDIGVILLPDGTHISIAVFVSDAACSMPECENIISAISAAVFGIVEHKPDM